MAIHIGKLSSRGVTATITGGYVYINMPDPTQASGYKTYQAKLEDFLVSGTGVAAYADYASLPGTGIAEVIYITLDDYALYLWDSGAYQSIGGGGGGHVIQEEGSPLTQRANLNFIGAGMTATDNAGSDSTDLTLTVKIYHGVESIGTITENNTNHTISISSITYWYKGTKFVSSGAILCDLDLTADRDNSANTLTANKLYYFYFKDATGKLYWSDASWNFKENVFVCTGFWNNAALAVQNEYHNHTRDLDWHIWAHDTIGLRYESGSLLTYPDAANDDTLQIETGTYHDEDIDFATGQCTTMRGWHQVSSGVYTFVDYALPYVGTTGQPQWLDTDDYTLKDVGATDFVNYWVYVSNDKDRKIYVIPTHAATAYNTLALARAASTPTTIGVNINPDFKLIYKFIYKGDGEFQEYVDYRSSSPLPGGGTGSITAGAVSFSPYNTISSTNVQSVTHHKKQQLKEV